MFKIWQIGPAILKREKTAIFTRRGELLWRSPAWGRCPGQDRNLLGSRWWEFIYPEDLPMVLEFFADDRLRHCQFRAMLPSTGCVAFLTYIKSSVNELVLVIGDVSTYSEVTPAPRTLV